MEPTLAIALPAMALGFGIGTILTWVRTNRYWRAKLNEMLPQQERAASEGTSKHPAVLLKEKQLGARQKIFEAFDKILTEKVSGTPWACLITTEKGFVERFRELMPSYRINTDSSILNDAEHWAKDRGYTFKLLKEETFGNRRARAVQISGWGEVAEQEKRKLLKPETDKERILKELDEEIQRASKAAPTPV